MLEIQTDTDILSVSRRQSIEITQRAPIASVSCEFGDVVLGGCVQRYRTVFALSTDNVTVIVCACVAEIDRNSKSRTVPAVRKPRTRNPEYC